jgi:ABC-type nitrate/sulfonate/bicarbonate transport system substrate-binding protein
MRRWFVVLTATLILSTASCLFAIAATAAPVRIAIVSRTVFYVPLWVADRLGYFTSEGIEPTIEIYDNAEKINEDLRSGRVQIAVSTPESVVVDAYRGGSLRLVAGNAGKPPHFIIAKPEIKTLADLRGARFGVLSMQEGTTYLVQHLAKVAGLRPDQYEILAVGGAPTRWRLLKEGKIDAGLQPFPLSYEAEAAGFNNLGPILNYIPDYQFTSVNVDSRWAGQNSDLVSAFLRALRRGHAYMAAHPNETAEIAAQELKTSVALARRALDDTARLKILAEDLAVSEAGLAYVFESLQSAGLISREQRFDFAKVVDQRYLLQSRALNVQDIGSHSATLRR